MPGPADRELAESERHAAALERLDLDTQLADEAEKSCAHRFKFIPDWLGDSNVVNGTVDCSFWRCTLCDLESDRAPDGWEPDLREVEREESWE